MTAPLRDFLDAQGLRPRLLAASPASRARFLRVGDRLVPVPLGPLGLLRTPLLSTAGKLRLLAEPFVRGGEGGEESVAEFATRRLGREASERLVAPFLVGVYAGDETRLGAEPVFPSLVDFERRHGSIVRGALMGALRRTPRGLSGSFSTADGLSGLVDPLAAGLGSALRRREPVRALRAEGERWILESERERLEARALVLATPADAAAALLAGVDAEAARLVGGIAYAPIACVALGARADARGFGFLVPPREKSPLLGCLFMSQLFPGRAPEGRELLHCMLGGARQPAIVDEPDDRLLERTLSELARVLALDDPECVAVLRWPRAVPQPGPLHLRRLRHARARLAGGPPLALAGAWVAGVSFGDSAASGLAAARSI